MILADTHAWLWWLTGHADLSRTARDAMEAEPVAVSAITLWEIALLAARQRIRLSEETAGWLRRAASKPGMQVLDLTPEVCALGAGFGDTLHRDPSDRIIVATALHHGGRLVTADRAITQSGLVQTVW